MKTIALLGSTGSIGRQTLDVVRASPEEFQIVALCAGRGEALSEQIAQFHPALVGVEDAARAKALAAQFPKIQFFAGKTAAAEIARVTDAQIVVNALPGFAGTAPLIAALERGKTVALANKESIVCAHALAEQAARAHGGRILPVDSEQSALFQAMQAGKKQEIRRLILTASGGPFRGCTAEQLAAVTPEQALRHPVWCMGRKVTLDSATLFNKGLEIMEAAYLFDVPGDKISVLIHPESILHSMVEYCDGSNIALLSAPDMRLAIRYALTYPNRTESAFGRLELAEAGRLTFFPPDAERFPALRLAYEALREGETLPIVYNGANEAAGELFLSGRIGFAQVAARVEYAMGHVPRRRVGSLEDIMELDRQARLAAAGKEG